MSKKKNNFKVNRQGIRDLNHLKGKSNAIKLALPPAGTGILPCAHPLQVHRGSQVVCSDCDEVIEEWW